MNAILWIGLGFLVVLVIFLIIAFFYKEKISRQQYTILKFLIALSAGFAGGFLAGTAIFNLDAELSNGINLAISGTSGVALFFSIWFYFPSYSEPTPPDEHRISIPENWSFKTTVESIVKAENAFKEFVGFTDEELDLILDSQEVHTISPKETILKLRYLNEKIPLYIVDHSNNVYKIIKKENAN